MGCSWRVRGCVGGRIGRVRGRKACVDFISAFGLWVCDIGLLGICGRFVVVGLGCLLNEGWEVF